MKKITLLAVFLITIIACKKNTSNTTNNDIKPKVETATVQISDSIKTRFDSIVYKVAKTNGCKMKAVIKGPNTLPYYSGLDARTNTKPSEFDELFEIGSCTKIFTATSILQLIEQNKLNLDDRLTTILPNDELYKNLLVIDGKNYIDSVKVINLLNHTSGLPDYVESDEDKLIAHYSDPSEKFTYEALIEMAKGNPEKKLFIPGSKFEYCNTNYILLALLIEKFSKQTYQDYVKAHIINPLELKNTYFGSLYPENKRPQGYYKGKVALMPFTLAGPAGEILSNLDDMQTFIDAWNKGLLFEDPNTIKNVKSQDFQTMVAGAITYGKGIINIMDLSYGHGGQSFGYQSYVGSMKSNNYSFVFYVDDANVSSWYPAIEISSLLQEIE
ncbi:beta-lactamase family protein [Tamlana sp. s12]|uniref:serine hydrolase domain-containing protein n=1 Tax=Tamlana sp. s12 TaxID=1630406 RepID=UPI00083946F3|nr:serine hydrolase domain-containing protein [Tamlana sp. s12]QQY81805.1 beta-lactamase family protein [Tamlana sp. s12]